MYAYASSVNSRNKDRALSDFIEIEYGGDLGVTGITATNIDFSDKLSESLPLYLATVVPWSGDVFVVDPSPVFETVARLLKKGGREIIARCKGLKDATEASEWLLNRVSRLASELSFSTELKPGGGQFVLWSIPKDFIPSGNVSEESSDRE